MMGTVLGYMRSPPSPRAVVKQGTRHYWTARGHWQTLWNVPPLVGVGATKIPLARQQRSCRKATKQGPYRKFVPNGRHGTAKRSIRTHLPTSENGDDVHISLWYSTQFPAPVCPTSGSGVSCSAALPSPKQLVLAASTLIGS